MTTVAQLLQEGWKHHQAGRVAEAERFYRQALTAAPSSANAWCYLGMACHDQSRFAQAEQAYEKALAIKRNFAVALSNYANTLNAQGRHVEAEQRCREALQYQPNYSSAYNNLGAALVSQGRLDEATACFEKALTENPNSAQLHGNLAAALVKQGRFDEAESSSQAALDIDPRCALARKNQAIVMLLKGDFEQGWDEYEWRWHSGELKAPGHSQPQWDGEPLEGKTVLLHAEQGLGDTIHFIRYAPLVKQHGGRVVVACQRPLLKLLSSCEGVDELIALDDDAAFDVHLPLLSIPRVLKTTLETIPDNVPYLHPDPNLVERWKGELSQLEGLKVGIAWQGNPKHQADKQRSIPLEHFAVLSAIPGVQLVSLQRGPGAEQLDRLAGRIKAHRFDENFDQASGAFMDTAAVMENLDLVISSDTAIAHLAGALGRPAWVALSTAPDWRWMLNRSDCPWYPTVRLYRQRTLGDWDEVFARMADKLRTMADPRTAADGGKRVWVETSFGELIDKITILEIKSQRIGDAEKLHNVHNELETLRQTLSRTLETTPELDELTGRLMSINEALWEIEDEIRGCEAASDFGERFVELARSVYQTNDERAAVKREINDLVGSRLTEEKSYKETS